MRIESNYCITRCNFNYFIHIHFDSFFFFLGLIENNILSFLMGFIVKDGPKKKENEGPMVLSAHKSGNRRVTEQRKNELKESMIFIALIRSDF